MQTIVLHVLINGIFPIVVDTRTIFLLVEKYKKKIVAKVGKVTIVTNQSARFLVSMVNAQHRIHVHALLVMLVKHVNFRRVCDSLIRSILFLLIYL